MEKEQHLIQHIETIKANSQQLMLEGFKNQSLLKMMNQCSDKCQLEYKLDGINDTENKQV